MAPADCLRLRGDQREAARGAPSRRRSGQRFSMVGGGGPARGRLARRGAMGRSGLLLYGGALEDAG